MQDNRKNNDNKIATSPSHNNVSIIRYLQSDSPINQFMKNNNNSTASPPWAKNNGVNNQSNQPPWAKNNNSGS